MHPHKLISATAICTPMSFTKSAPDPTLLMYCESWPGIPRGVEFKPSDSDTLWHLTAEVGNGHPERHPFINDFIKYVDDDRGLGRMAMHHTS